MSRTRENGVVIWGEKDAESETYAILTGIPKDSEGGYAGGDSTADAINNVKGAAERAYQTVDNLTVTTTSLDYGQEPTATLTGNLPNKTLNLGIPKGIDGDTGQQLVADAQVAAAAAQQAATDADEAVTLAQQAQAAAYAIPDEANQALIENPATLTAASLEARRAFTYATDHGAVGDGVTDDTAAIQAALDTGKNVILPAGTFNVTGLTLATSGQRLSGWSRATSKIVSTSGDVLTTNPTGHVGSFELTDLWIESRAGGGHCLNIPFGIHQSMFSRVDIVQRNNDKSAIHCDRTGFTNGGLFDVKFTDFRISMPDTSTVPGIYLVGGGNPASACLWHRGRIEGGGTYLVHIEAARSATTYAYDNAFDSINFEFADHGAIRLLSALNTTLTKVGLFDNGTIDTDLISVGRTTGGPVARGVNINGLHRSGGSLSGGAVDVRFNQPMGGGNHVSAVSAPAAAGMILDVGNTDTFLAGIDSTVFVASTQATTGSAHFTLAGTPIFAGAEEPEGLVTAPAGALYLRTAGPATGRIYNKDSGSGNTGWRSSSQPPGQPEANLASASHVINTGAKAPGRTAFDTTNMRPVWATGGAAADPWVDATGTAIITPS